MGFISGVHISHFIMAIYSAPPSKSCPNLTFQASTRYHMFRQVVPVMNCSSAKNASPQIMPASSLEQFLTVASGVVVTGRWEDKDVMGI